MSSSTFEVTETDNETEKGLSFGLEACEENGIGLSAQVDGEVPKDHTYTKDPDPSEEKPEDSQEEESEKANPAIPEKRVTRNPKNSKNLKKTTPGNAKVKKEIPAKKVAASKKVKAKKEVLTEESNKSDDNAKPEQSDEKNDIDDQQKPSRRGKKRKVEEKENVIDRSIVEEVQNISEGDTTATEAGSGSTPKKNAPNKVKSKKPKISPPTVEDGDGNQNLPKGWVRKVVVRKSGKTAGQVDIYIYSPDGIKFRSRPDIAAYLTRTKSNLKLDDFNFSKKKKKKISEDSVVKTVSKKEKPTSAAKPKSTSEKKKGNSTSVAKRGSKLLVKLNFSPKSKKGKDVKKTSVKVTKQTKSSVKKGKASSSSSKTSKKKKV